VGHRNEFIEYGSTNLRVAVTNLLQEFR
jgi:hypothetical protein